METETLSSYEQSSEKNILSGVNSDNISNHDDDSNSLHANENSEANSDVLIESKNSSDTKDNSDVSNSENNKDTNDSVNVEEHEDTPTVSSNNDEEEVEVISADEQEDPLRISMVDEEINDSPIQEDGENSGILSDNDKENENNDIVNEDKTESKEPHESENSDDANENETESNIPHGTENKDITDDKEIESADPQESENREVSENETKQINEDKNKNDEVTNKEEASGDKDAEVRNEEKVSEEDKDAEGNKEVSEEDKNVEVTNKVEASVKDKGADKKNSNECSLLKETLTKGKDQIENKEGEGENGIDEMDLDDDFDPSLLCPDIAMEVEESPVITTTGNFVQNSSDNIPTDGDKSPLLYEPVYSTYVDEMTGAEISFNLTPEEHQLRQDTYGPRNPIQYTKIHCTACNVHLGSALDGQGNRFVHPLLKVLICKDCYHFYTSGEFEKDEDGSELYCRWCGQGGQVICCSNCEMVFCKKCIRINFGRRKLTEIRDSDEWACFRCNPIQLSFLRVHCVEFIEYVRREISRAATLENATSFMTTDYTHCCTAQKNKYVEPQESQPKKRKRKHLDPDYSPELDDSLKVDQPLDAKSPRVVPILPKPADPNLNAGIVTHVTQGSNLSGVFKVGNTVFKPRNATYTQARPLMQATSSGNVNRPTSTPGFIKIMPGGIRVTPPANRQPAQTIVTSSVRPQSFQQRQVRAPTPSNSATKHEWFEKTVRAAARVNSNLSYTLTQLNRAQASASSVEALAVVHNKLQEILSTSINTLIQIRKNLRTEFIAGIKNIRFPPKPPQPRPLPSTSTQDDDVIFVSPTSSPVPPPLAVVTPNSLPPSVVLTTTSNALKRPYDRNPIVPTTSLQPIPSTSSVSDSTADKPKVFLRVKSLSALQNVPSECITIPDDPPQLPPLTPIKAPEKVVTIDESPEKKVENEGEETKNLDEKDDKNPDEDVSVDISKKEVDVNGSKESILYNFKTPNVKLLNIEIHLERSEEIDKLVRSKFELMNGDTSN